MPQPRPASISRSTARIPRWTRSQSAGCASSTSRSSRSRNRRARRSQVTAWWCGRTFPRSPSCARACSSSCSSTIRWTAQSATAVASATCRTSRSVMAPGSRGFRSPKRSTSRRRSRSRSTSSSTRSAASSAGAASATMTRSPVRRRSCSSSVVSTRWWPPLTTGSWCRSSRATCPRCARSVR